MVLLFNSFY